ncbi:MAG: endolytic transglycosylase MltG [Clostridia bacterium]|nr:endolytic transglycosylase MltG [Clostridia bacterium]
MSEDNKNEKSPASDELFDILKEYRSAPDERPAEEDVYAQVPHFDEDGTDDAISIISDERDGKKPDVKSPEIPEGEGDEIPDSIYSHLSEEGDVREAEPEIEIIGTPSVSGHFTESFTPVEAPEKEKDKDEPSRLSRAGKFLGSFSAIPKAVIYIVVVLLISAYLSYFAISIGNDVFALVPDSEGTVEVDIPEGATDAEVAKILEDSGVIEYGWVYKLYMKYRGSGDSAAEYIPGKHTVDRTYNYSQIITALTTNKVERTVVRIMIPEGYTVDQIIDLFLQNGLGERKKFVEAINEYPFKHEFVRLLDETGYPETRKYRLEGYLFPDTYDFYNTSSEVSIINKLLNNFNDKFWKDFTKVNSQGVSYRSLMIEKYGMNFDELITVASMVQSEGKSALDFEYISFVFHNRLSHKKSFPCLESDATIQYALPERIKDSSQIDVSYDSPYNTYINQGLPPGAISNPGLDALFAAMFPSAPLDSKDKEIDAYYFVSNNAGKTYYAATHSGHEKNVAQVKKDNEAIEKGTYDG